MKTKIALGDSFVVDGVRLTVMCMPSTPVPVKLVVNGSKVVLFRKNRQQSIKAFLEPAEMGETEVAPCLR